MSAHSSGLLPPDEVKMSCKPLIYRCEFDCEIEHYIYFIPFVQLADLHIFVVPLDLWLEKYRTAFNNIALESVSAGFVR